MATYLSPWEIETLMQVDDAVLAIVNRSHAEQSQHKLTDIAGLKAILRARTKKENNV